MTCRSYPPAPGDEQVMEILKAIQYKNINQALSVLEDLLDQPPDLFDDQGSEPQGLLTVIPEDRLPEESFYRLLDQKKGTLVNVEKIPYSGYGPPAQEDDFMGFVGEKLAYILVGCRLPIEIENCPDGARDIHHLEAMVMDGQHSFDTDHLSRELGLSGNWDFDQLFQLIVAGTCTAELIDQLLHAAQPNQDR